MNENKDTEIISNTLFESTTDRYNKEFERSQHIDYKAGTQIGFSGIIISIIGIVFYSKDFSEISDLEINMLIIGVAILLLSIVFGIAVLTKIKKTIPVFLPEAFYDNHKGEDEDEQRRQMFLIFLDLIYYFEKANERDAKLLYYGNIATLIGLVISFISFILIIR